VIIRRATPGERLVLHDLHAAAFRTDTDAVAIFDRLHDDGDAVDRLSLVALDEGTVVGHALGSDAWVDDHEVIALGPIGVLPAFQGRGIGSALVHAFLGAADALDSPLVALLGSTAYYARFGFVLGSELGVDAPENVPAAHFQVRPLASYDPAVRGRFRYAPAFTMP
jgi:putative acetyltransferase